MTKNAPYPLLWIIAALLAGGIPVHAQSAPSPIDPSISKLAARVAEPLQEAHATKIVVAEFWGPEGQSHPIGKYLADQLTLSLQRDFPTLGAIERPEQKKNSNDHPKSGDMHAIVEDARNWACKIGANIVLAGSFARASQGIGVSISPEFCNDSRKSLRLTTALIPITDEIAAASSEPIPSPTNGIAHAGTGGTTLATCIHCPFPNYSPKAKAAKYQGTVVLDIEVTAQGRADRIIVLKSPGMGLEEKSIEAVKKWKFKPAAGPDGSPVAVRTEVEVSFHLF
jgi:TonB family protein